MIIEATPSMYIKDQSLSDEVQAWIDAGNKVNDCSNLVKVKSNFNSAGERVNKAELKARNLGHSNAMQQRQDKQVPLLKSYQAVSNKRTCWMDLSNAIGGCISAAHLSKTSKGKTSIQNEEVWGRVEKKIKEILGAKHISAN